MGTIPAGLLAVTSLLLLSYILLVLLVRAVTLLVIDALLHSSSV